MIKIALIGSTGSIGKQVLNVSQNHSDKIKITAITANENAKLLFEQAVNFNVEMACLNKPFLKNEQLPFQLVAKEDAYLQAIEQDVDEVIIATTGFSAVKAILKCIQLKKDICLANKECLVCCGDYLMQEIEKNGINIYPIDSEHSAIWQCLNFDRHAPFKRLIITASGGAFRHLKVEELKNVKAKQALLHPNWLMGEKITIDCSTMVNKALEVIEAKHLFATEFDKIDVIVHKQSIIHSMVEFLDSTVISSMSYPSMEIPISLAIFKGERKFTNKSSLNFATLHNLTFEQLDEEKYPCFNLCVNAGKMGGTFPLVMSCANEGAVHLFLKGKITFFQIRDIIEDCLLKFATNKFNIEEIFEIDTKVRNYITNKWGF